MLGQRTDDFELSLGCSSLTGFREIYIALGRLGRGRYIIHIVRPISEGAIIYPPIYYLCPARLGGSNIVCGDYLIIL